MSRAPSSGSSSGSRGLGDTRPPPRPSKCRRERVEVAGVEAVGVAGLDEELLGSPGIVGRWVEGQRVLEGSWNYAPGGSGEAQRLGLIDGLPIDGEARGEPHAPVVPGRPRVPLIEQLQPEDSRRLRGHELEARGSPDILGDRPTEQIDDVYFAVLQGRGTRRFFRNGA